MENKKMDFLENSTQAGLALAEALEKARKAAQALASTSKQVKRTLAGFDQIKRLGEKKKSGSSRKSSQKKKEEPVTQQVQQQQQQVLTFQEYLDHLDLSVLDFLPGRMSALSITLENMSLVGQRLWTIWNDQMHPVGQWIHETLIPAMDQFLPESFHKAAQIITGFGVGFSQSWQQMKQEAKQGAQDIYWQLLEMGGGFEALAVRIFGSSQQISNDGALLLQQFGLSVENLLAQMQSFNGDWDNLLSNMQTGLHSLVAGTVTALQNVLDYVQGSFVNGWQSGFSGLKEPAQGALNGVVGFMNKFLGGMSGTVNAMVDTVNKLKIKIPEWVPTVGGKQYGFALKPVSTPQIPYLAQGAVLPANQPFLAVVGDQKHGTNVEAPLSTIQEAVAAVMADHTAGNMAGHEATVAVLNRILEAVLGIDVGETVIARAAQSYRMKEVVMKGGGF